MNECLSTPFLEKNVLGDVRAQLQGRNMGTHQSLMPPCPLQLLTLDALAYSTHLLGRLPSSDLRKLLKLPPSGIKPRVRGFSVMKGPDGPRQSYH